MKRYSKTKLARAYLRLSESQGEVRATRALAAALITQNLTHEVELAAREITRQLLRAGQALVTITTAHKLSSSAQREIEHAVQKLTPTAHLVASYQVNPALLGGFQAETPTHTVHASVAALLNRLSA